MYTTNRTLALCAYGQQVAAGCICRLLVHELHFSCFLEEIVNHFQTLWYNKQLWERDAMLRATRLTYSFQFVRFGCKFARDVQPKIVFLEREREREGCTVNVKNGQFVLDSTKWSVSSATQIRSASRQRWSFQSHAPSSCLDDLRQDCMQAYMRNKFPSRTRQENQQGWDKIGDHSSVHSHSHVMQYQWQPTLGR